MNATYEIKVEATTKHDARRAAWKIINDTFKDKNVHYNGIEQTSPNTYTVSFVRFYA